jgi:5,10-methylenetetrahydromethanopterin reductase
VDMSAPSPAVGMCFDRTFPATEVVAFARRLEEGGADQLWIIEDCFFTAGISLAATALAVTDRLQVGLGILPAVARNPAVTAMEIATLCALAPGRVIPGIGHGVQSWMEQMGARTPSPVTTLEEVIAVVKRLLAGEQVTFEGRHVHLTDVALDPPPPAVPPVLAGVRGPRSLAMAGRVADGLVLADPGTPAHVRTAVAQSGYATPLPVDEFHVAVFSTLCVERDRRTAYEAMAPWLAGFLEGSGPEQSPNPGLAEMDCFDDLTARFADRGVDGLVDMPPEWWTEIGPIGTMDDAIAHLHTLVEAGAHSIALFPAPELEVARGQVDDVLTLAAALR